MKESRPKEYLDLKGIIEEERSFYKKGFDRIREFYSLPENMRQEKTRLKKPPHEILGKDSEVYVSNGISALEKDEIYFTDRYIFNSLIGIGTEVLLKAIILKIHPEIITKGDKEDRVRFETLKQTTSNYLKAKLDEKQVDRVKDVLELVQLRRNKRVHGGLHKFDHYAVPYQIAHVLEFLYRHFFPETSKEIIKQLGGFKEEQRKHISGMDFEPVPLP